jgi:hypothetical protein
MMPLTCQKFSGDRCGLFSAAALIVLLLHAASVAATAGSLTFGGVAFSPGSTVKANVPLSTEEKSLASQGGNAVPPYAVAVLATPSNFDPRRSWPVLVVCSTSDSKRQNRDDLADFYGKVGIREGWLVLAGDGPQRARNDNSAWRGAMSLAAIDALQRSFPGANKWPVACGGFSGGGKGVGVVAPLLAKHGSHVVGIYITGANEDRLSEGYARVAPGPGFLTTPVYIAAGRDDRIATVEQQYDVAGSIKRTGFQRLKIGTFHGGHEANDAQTSIALHWFLQLAK